MNREEAQAWEELLEAFHREPDETSTPSWPEAENLDPEPAADAETTHKTVSGDHDHGDHGDHGTGQGAQQEHEAHSTWSSPQAPAPGPRDHLAPDVDEHFVPPDPPPLPRGSRTNRLAWSAALGMPVLAVFLVLTGLQVPTVVLVAMVVAFVGGCLTLIARMRTDDDPGPDAGGAVL